MADMSDNITIGTVIESLPNATFRVQFDNKDKIVAYLSGKMRLHRIKVLVGDNVKVEMSEYGKTKGRIIHRM